MSIINSYHKNSKPIINVEDLYKKSEITFDSFIVTFSKRVIDILIEDNIIELISEDSIKSISCTYPVYRFKGTNIGIIKTTVGASLTSGLIEEVAYIYSCNKVIMFGTCGSLDKNIPINKLIVPSYAYRDEGVSYHYMEPSDYIKIENADSVCNILDELGVEYIVGKTWTTDTFYRETIEEMRLRKEEGCIVVEMELSACQAVANYKGIKLFNFLYRADNLDSYTWEKGQRDSKLSKDERLKILNIAFMIAKRV